MSQAKLNNSTGKEMSQSKLNYNKSPEDITPCQAKLNKSAAVRRHATMAEPNTRTAQKRIEAKLNHRRAIPLRPIPVPAPVRHLMPVPVPAAALEITSMLDSPSLNRGLSGGVYNVQ